MESCLLVSQLPNSGPRPASPKRNKRNRAKWTLHARSRPLVNVANSLTSPGSPARGRTQTNPLMAGRRRRTPAAALRWPRCRCRCRSSSRSTCAGIECHSSPPRSTRRRPRDRLCSMAWRFTTASALIPRITWLTGRVPHSRSIQIAAAGGRVRIKLNLRCSVIIICSGTKRSARRREHVHHRCARDDASTHGRR